MINVEILNNIRKILFDVKNNDLINTSKNQLNKTTTKTDEIIPHIKSDISVNNETNKEKKYIPPMMRDTSNSQNDDKLLSINANLNKLTNENKDKIVDNLSTIVNKENFKYFIEIIIKKTANIISVSVNILKKLINKNNDFNNLLLENLEVIKKEFIDTRNNLVSYKENELNLDESHEIEKNKEHLDTIYKFIGYLYTTEIIDFKRIYNYIREIKEKINSDVFFIRPLFKLLTVIFSNDNYNNNNKKKFDFLKDNITKYFDFLLQLNSIEMKELNNYYLNEINYLIINGKLRQSTQKQNKTTDNKQQQRSYTNNKKNNIYQQPYRSNSQQHYNYTNNSDNNEQQQQQSYTDNKQQQQSYTNNKYQQQYRSKSQEYNNRYTNSNQFQQRHYYNNNNNNLNRNQFQQQQPQQQQQQRQYNNNNNNNLNRNKYTNRNQLQQQQQRQYNNNNNNLNNQQLNKGVTLDEYVRLHQQETQQQQQQQPQQQPIKN